MEKEKKHDIFLIIDSPFFSQRLHGPLSHPLFTRLDGLSLSLKSLFKFIVDSYLTMKLNAYERKLAKIVSEMSCG